MSETLTATWSKGPYKIKAEWGGGEYISLTMPESLKPSEVINIWDYGTSAPSIPFTRLALLTTLEEWCEDTFGESNPDGAYNLHAYIENASY